MNNYAFLDIETSGLNPAVNCILQVGVVFSDESFEEIDTFNSLVKPYEGAIIEDQALEKNRISIEDCYKAPSEYEVLLSLNEKLTKHSMPTIAGFNLNFDLNFLKSAYFRNKLYLVFDGYTLDLQGTARNIGGLYRYSLKGVCQDLSIYQENAHDALSDARTTLEVARKLLRTTVNA